MVQALERVIFVHVRGNRERATEQHLGFPHEDGSQVGHDAVDIERHAHLAFTSDS